MRIKKFSMLVIAIIIMVSSANIKISADNDTAARLSALQSSLPQLQSLISQCKAKYIPTDYESVSYNVIQRFIGYGMQDLSSGAPERAEYIAARLETIYNNATFNLNAYLSESKTALEVPRYLTGDISVSNQTSNGLVTSLTGGTKTAPVMFSGAGNTHMTYADISNFSKFGYNYTQIEIGPSHILCKPGTVFVGWDTVKSQGVNADITADTINKNEQHSMKLVNYSQRANNVYISANKTVSVQPSTTYNISFWVKGDNANGGVLIPDNAWNVRYYLPTGSFDWTYCTTSFTTSSTDTTATIRFVSEDVTTQMWIDDVTMTAAGSSINLIENSTFENVAQPTGVAGIMYDGQSLDSNLIQHLKNAQAGNIAVSLLLSPHYFPSWAYSLWPDTVGYQHGFIKFNITSQNSKNVIQAYLQTVMTNIKGIKSLHDVVLSNEPIYTTYLDNNFNSAWRSWLISKYSNISNLNLAYGTLYFSFNQVTQPTSVSKTVKYYDWMTFNNQLFADWHGWMANIVHNIDSNIKVNAKIMPFAFSRENLSNGIDYELFASVMDYNGCDGYNFLESAPVGFYDTMMYYDLLRSLKNVPVVNSEDHFIADNNTDYGLGHALLARGNSWQGMIHGRTASVVWCWQRDYGNSTLTDTVLFRPDVIDALGKTALDGNRLAEDIKAIQEQSSVVAILYSPVATLYSDAYVQDCKNAYRAVLSTGQRPVFVTENQIANGALSNYKVLILPSATNVKQSAVSGMKQFVQNQGKVLAIGTNLTANEANSSISSTDRNAVLTGSMTLSSGSSVGSLTTSILNLLESKNVVTVTSIDTATGNPALNVEVLSCMKDGQLMINLCNYNASSNISVSVKYGSKSLKMCIDKLSGQYVDASNLILTPFSPVLLSCGLISYDDVVDAVASSGDGKIRLSWKINQDGYNLACAGIKVYDVNDNLIATVPSGQKYYVIDGLSNNTQYSYKIKVLYDDGIESSGVAVFGIPSVNALTLAGVSINRTQTEFRFSFDAINNQTINRNCYIRADIINTANGSVVKNVCINHTFGAYEKRHVESFIKVPADGGSYSLRIGVYTTRTGTVLLSNVLNAQ